MSGVPVSSKAGRRGRTTRNPAPVGLVPDGLRINARALRSANVEHDLGASNLQRYVVTTRSLEMAQRVMSSLEDPTATRAWSVTGPYGSGKSSFALFLAALLCSPTAPTGGKKHAANEGQDEARDAALAVLAHDAPELADRFAEYQREMGGMLRALVTARREPVAVTVARALTNAIAARWGTRPPSAIKSVLADLGQNELPTPDLVLGAVRICADHAPVLLVIDEFGKNLEYFAAHGADADASEDLFLLQELAELAAGGRAAPITLLTFQHASFVDYAGRAAALQRREWAKVQGRFVDVTFVDTPGDVAALVSGTIDRSQLDDHGVAALRRYGRTVAAEWANRGYQSILSADEELLAATYPLHPLTVATLPALCATLGQHDRTLAGFMTGDEPHTVDRFLADAAQHAGVTSTKTTSSTEHLATVRLPQLFDYFATAVRGPMLASAGASRWLEIEDRLASAHGLPETDASLLKTVAVLNLVDSSGALRASAENIAFAANDPEVCRGRKSVQAVQRQLDRLVKHGFLTYRERADEYRLWAGSDTDIRAHIQAARDRFADADVASLLSHSYAPSAVVAGKHSQVTGFLRYFATRVTDASSNDLEDGGDKGADGLLVLHIGSAGDAPKIVASVPVLVGITPDVEVVVDNAREVLSLNDLLLQPELDAVARREVAERLVAARTDLTAVFARAYAPDRDDVIWLLHMPSDKFSAEATVPKPQRLTDLRSLSALVSRACDEAYPESPEIRNEMLGRHQLTSQGAKARRELINALIRNPTAEAGGLVGNGPERAMYDGVLKYLGLHRPAEPSQETLNLDLASARHRTPPGFTKPAANSSASKSFTRLVGMLRTANDETTVEALFDRLAAPPYGVKAGVLPLMLLSALMQTKDDVAIFDDGTFLPRITGDLFERIVKTPDRITVRHIPVRNKHRGAVIDELHRALDVAHSHGGKDVRNASILRITSALLDVIRGADFFSLNTQTISPEAQSVRSLLQTARDPDQLIFTDLREALGFTPVKSTTRTDEADVKKFAKALAKAVGEIRAVPRTLQAELAITLKAAFRLPESMQEARMDLAAQSRHITSAVVDPSMRGLVHHFQNLDMPDDDWLAHTAMLVESNPVTVWRDENLTNFQRRVRELAATFSRLYALHYDVTHADDGEAFDARRLTLTRPDGGEEHVLLSVPDSLTDDAAVLVRSVLSEAHDRLGTHGDRVLLAALAKELLEGRSDQGRSVQGKATAGRGKRDAAQKSTDQRRRRRSS